MAHKRIPEFDCVINVAGGWVGGTIADENLLASVDKMWSFNVQSAVLSSHLACKHLKEGGLLVLTGAAAGLSPTPGMIGYGITKAATHHLIKSLAANESGMPAGSTVAGILPITLDTIPNREAMPKANFETWTPLNFVGSLLVDWACGNDRPNNGNTILPVHLEIRNSTCLIFSKMKVLL